MVETSKDGRTGSSLAPVARRTALRRRLRWALVAVVAAAAGAVVLVRPWRPDCRTAAREATDPVAVTVCEREFEDTHDPEVGVLLADAYRRTGKLDVAAAIANGLLATHVQADALQILGRIAFRQGRLDEATEALERARALHRAANRRAALARDNQTLAGVMTRRKQYAEALRMLDECIAESRLAGDSNIRGYCHVAAAQVLSRVGYFEASEQEIAHARPLLTTPREQAWFLLEQGNLQQEGIHRTVKPSELKLSVYTFEQARQLATRAQLTELALSSELNLTYSLAEDGRPDEAARHLDAAHSLDRNNSYASQRAQLASRIAYRRGDLQLASSLNDRLYDTIDDSDERLEIATMQARIALATSNLGVAEQWARRGVADAEKIRAAQSALELRAWVLSRRRAPYELLFTALARAGKLDAALAVFDQWHGGTLLDAVSRSSEPVELRGAATQLDRLGAWFPTASAAPLMKAAPAREVVELHGTDLLALVMAEKHLWLVTARRGALRIADLGPFKDRKNLLDRFASEPTNPALGDELGALLLQDDVHRATRDALRVILDGPVAGLPIAGLRRGGQPLIAVRPIVHAPRVAEVACVPTTERTGKATVLADPEDNLPSARREALIISSLLGTTSAVGSQATSQALFGAAGQDVLHVAAHADIELAGGVLRLHDEKVSALEIAARRLGPSLVVLSACSSGRSNGAELAGALSTAFLAGGSTQVVGTLAQVSDAGALEVTTRFYRDGGVRDPVRVLARIQAELVDTANKDWPSFAVFGRDLCEAPPTTTNPRRTR
jgi:tetratricopeptide (TPR) repeat protein